MLKLINLSKQRRQDHQLYKLIGLINGLKQEQQIIRQLQTPHSGGALVQLQDHHEQLIKNYAQNSEFMSITSLLMELCSDSKINSDNDNVQVIVDNINDLIESMFDVQKREMYAEDWAEKFFQQNFQFIIILIFPIELDKKMLDYLVKWLMISVAAEFAQQRLEDLQQQVLLQQIIYDNKVVKRKSFEIALRKKTMQLNKLEFLEMNKSRLYFSCQNYLKIILMIELKQHFWKLLCDETQIIISQILLINS